MLVVVVLLLIAVDILLTQASMLILAVLDQLLLVMTVLIAVAVLKVNGKYLELVLRAVVTKLVSLTGIYLTLALSLSHR